MIKKIIFTICAAFLLAGNCFAYYNPGEPQGYVNDFAQVMSEESRVNLENELKNFEAETTSEIVVVTIKSLQEDYIENFAEKLFQEWGIGKKDDDNGVLFLVAVDDRQMRIEVGYGLEGALTDLQSNRILEQAAKPNFQAGDYGAGITATAAEIEKAIKGEEFVGSSATPGKISFLEKLFDSFGFFLFIFAFIIIEAIGLLLGKTKSWWLGGVLGAGLGLIIGLIVWSLVKGIIFFIILGFIGLLVDYGASRRGWFKGRGKGGGMWFGGLGGGGSGGGFGGFGGGRSGGGGSSGSW
ncbi:TPM domain-containing protein [Patescibacteria group bacterium]|nr:TPM domain-containing protein [Patescibacteria group bacterium]